MQFKFHFKTISNFDYKKYESALVSLYIEAFSAGKSFQYHNPKETSDYLQSIFALGYGIMAFSDETLCGAILLTSLISDKLVPETISDKFNLNKSVYVAEMMVGKNWQGKGIGKQLLQEFLNGADKNKYTDSFIRVWIENEAAIGLYKKMGFKPCASIVQPKLLADKSRMFNFEKIYLHQKLK
jgi:ribosomal protein S18 acetylase RimI-like enzyme